MSDYEEFKKDAKKVKKFVKKWFGKKCPEFCKSCECCKRWHHTSHLIENPFKEDKRDKVNDKNI